ncbi:FadR/GntR family transcriptional regulator [Mesorhizobium sp. ANAO-SY3R2]|uniref:FadR/GntR family transcriptional regulator n=1 Tax=Mesorhizobium sp. ANAO-SY3R2 TaxID=3166644 RepID=UPI00366C3ACA
MTLKSIKPLKRAPLLHVSVQESLRSYIDDNGLTAGAPLPPEGELAVQLGVSRNSVREGIKALESVGVLESRRGIGVFVKAFSFEPLLDNLAYGLGGALKQIEEVIIIRRTLEVGLIDKTLELIGPDDIRELRETVDKMRFHAERGESFPDEDRHFHQLLFRCQDNDVLLGLLEVFWLAFYKASDFVNLDNADPMQTWRDHAAIVDAVEAGDLAGAKDRLDKHYEGINRVIAHNKTNSSSGRTT